MRNSRCLFALPLLATLVACSAPPVEDESGESGDAISDREAAKDFKGAEVVVQRFDASPAVKEKVGVDTWSVWGVNNKDFRGSVLFAKDRDGDVKYAVLIGQRSGKTMMAIVNYDKAGKSLPTRADAKTLETLDVDLRSIKKRLDQLAAQSSEDCKTFLLVAAGSIALVAVGWWLAVPSTLVVLAGGSVGWMSYVLMSVGSLANFIGVGNLYAMVVEATGDSFNEAKGVPCF